MADSISSLRIKLDAANAEIERLRGMVIDPVEKIVKVHEIVEVDVPRDVIRVVSPPPVVQTVYVDNPVHLETIKALQDKLGQWQEQ